MKVIKNTLLLAALLVCSISFAQKSTIEIPPNQDVEIDFPNYTFYELDITNKTGNEIGIKVINKFNDEFKRGFGLAGKAKVMVEGNSKIIFSNATDKMGKISFKVTEKDQMPAMNEPYVSFKLINTSRKSIPLIIPGVMNPNLSPKSSSGVDLKMGQEIYFKSGTKKHLLLVVDQSIKENEKLDVAELLQERKKELGL